MSGEANSGSAQRIQRDENGFPATAALTLRFLPVNITRFLSLNANHTVTSLTEVHWR
jgi:hypothetical protein